MIPVLLILSVLGGVIEAALRIFGGRDADPMEYPYVVRLGIKYSLNQLDAYFEHFQFLCTASVLTPVWTLTAGHCVDDAVLTFLQSSYPTASLKYVIMYGSATAHRSTTDNFSDIVATVKHPSYNSMALQLGASGSNDVALAKTTSTKLTKYAKLSAVEYPSLVGQAAIAVGYGITFEGDQVDHTLQLGKTLQVLHVMIGICAKDFRKNSLSPIICLSRLCSQPATILCRGDSGGPLLHDSGVVGINHMVESDECTLRSANSGLVKSSTVGINVPISPYVGWISNQIREKEEAH
ncbi:plasma kallikrein-like [Ostrinia nubilalis]|uniref:plasma kallikrein-like n=1 Tax=Ostrinia nubilalis TaxID=29057 RepID=UPI003082534B